MADELTTPLTPATPETAAKTPTPTTPTPTPTVQPPTWNPAEYEEFIRLKVQREQDEANIRRREEEAQQKVIDAAREKGDAAKLATVLEERYKQDSIRTQKEAAERIEAERKAAAKTKETADQELAARDNQIRATQARAEKFALEGEVSRALSNFDIVPESADDLTELLTKKFIVQAQGESFAVRTAAGQTPAEFIGAFLQSKPHYLKAKNPQGGTGGGHGNLGAPVVTNLAALAEKAPPVGLNFGETLVWMGENGEVKGAVTPEIARKDMSKPMGLRKID